MALSKQFLEGVASLNARGAELASKLQSLGQYAVKLAYTSNGSQLEACTYLINGIPQYMRKPLAAWFKRAGLEVLPPQVGGKDYVVQCVVDQKRQGSAFEFIGKTPVILTEHKVIKEKTVKPLEGTALKRAADAAASLITKIGERDPEAAAVLNAKFAGVDSQRSCEFYTADGKLDVLTKEEAQGVAEYLSRIRTQETANLVRMVAYQDRLNEMTKPEPEASVEATEAVKIAA